MLENSHRDTLLQVKALVRLRLKVPYYSKIHFPQGFLTRMSAKSPEMRENVFLVHHTPRAVIELSYHICLWFLLPKNGFIFHLFDVFFSKPV